jgi:general nucleoside transport system permease protein
MSARAGELPWWADTIIIPVLNLAVAFLVSGIVIWAIGESPLGSASTMLTGAFGSGEGIGYTLFYATNFIFTGLAFAVAFHAGLFNIGVEGQAYIGGLGVALACLYFEWLPQPVIILLAIVFSAVFGAAWAFIPAILQAKRGSHLVITTIMFNFIASALMVYLLVNYLKPDGVMEPGSRTFANNARLPLMQDAASWFGLTIAQSPLNLSFVWALVCAAGFSVLIWRTRLGYELRTLGASRSAALYAGMPVTRLTVIALMISGALGGFLALNEVMGSQNRLFLDFSGGYGFVGIAVALMGRSRALGIVLAAVLFGALYQGGAELAFDTPAITRDIVVLIQGLVILTAGALEHMFRPALTRLFAPSSALGQEA